MLLRILTALAFFIFLFAIINVGFQTHTGLFIKHAISSVPWGDKSLHFILLTTFTMLLNASMHRQKMNLLGFHLLTGSLLLACGITLEECSQVFIPSRNFELMDMVCNYAGIYAGSYLPGLLKLKHGTNTADEHSETLLLQAIHHQTGPLQHESGHGRRAARRMGRRHGSQ